MLKNKDNPQLNRDIFTNVCVWEVRDQVDADQHLFEEQTAEIVFFPLTEQ